MKNILKVVLSVAVVIAIGGGYLFPKFAPLGSVVGPELLSPFFSVDGVRHEYRRVKLATATTTPCAVRSPSATSTLLSASVQINVATSTATTWTLAKATTGFATTTALSVFSLGSGELGTLTYSATTTGVDTKDVISPNTFLVWGAAGFAPAGTTLLTGVCQAEFLVN